MYVVENKIFIHYDLKSGIISHLHMYLHMYECIYVHIKLQVLQIF